MLKLRILTQTWIKKELKNSGELNNTQKTLAILGEEIDISQIVIEKNHFVTKNAQGETIYIYKYHAEVINPKIIYKELDVPYLSQRSNKINPFGTCNVTSMAMVLKYYGKVITPDNLSLICYQRSYQNTLHADLVKLVKEYGITSKFSTQTKLTDIFKTIDTGNPVVLSAYFTTSGHIVAVKGYDLTSQPTLILNDPYGKYSTKYSDHDGQGSRLLISDLNKINGNSTPLYWAHLFSR